MKNMADSFWRALAYCFHPKVILLTLLPLLLMLVIGGTGWLYGGILGAVVFKVLQDVLSSITPQYWTFWLGLFLVVLMLVGREKLLRPWTWFKKGGAS